MGSPRKAGRPPRGLGLWSVVQRSLGQCRNRLYQRPSSLPLVFVDDEFLRGNVLGGFREIQVSNFAIDFGAQLGRDGVEARSGNFLQVAGGDFRLETFELCGERLPALVAFAKNAIGKGLGFRGTEVLNLELVLAAPLDEGGLGDLKFDRDAVEAPSLRTQEDETGNGFLVGHN